MIIDGEEVITMAEARKALGMSRIQFVDLLNDDSGYRLVTSYEEDVREYIKKYGYRGSININYFTVDMLKNEYLYIEEIDWECFFAKYNIALKNSNIIEPKEAESSTTISKYEEKIRTLERHIVELEQQLAEKHKQSSPMPERDKHDSFLAAFPILHLIYTAYSNGVSREAIAIALQEAGKATSAQAAWLTKDDDAYASDAALKQRMKRIKQKYNDGDE